MSAPAVGYAAALSGADPSLITDVAALSAAASDEAGALIDNVDLLARTLTATIDTQNERCVSSLRGPVQWSETITARANALGNEDVFVCATSFRSFNTVENRVLVVALAALAKASSVQNQQAAELFDSAALDLISARSDRARKWLAVPRLKTIPRGRLTRRELTQFRNSRRGAWMHTVMAFRQRQQRGFDSDEFIRLCDPWTIDLHGFVVDTARHIERHERVPQELALLDGTITAGRLSFRHPGANGGSIPGLAYRGIPLAPGKTLVSEAPWAGDLPARAVRINGASDVERLLTQLGVSGPRRR
ncbi:MAG: hypothetical protein KDB26_03395 [Microthrixaceae bacterium]|nr:hypothetical protein [Microthrixaceae bacterium]